MKDGRGLMALLLTVGLLFSTPACGSIGRYALHGDLIGGAVGAAVGYAAGNNDDFFSRGGATVLGALVGAVLGGVIGALTGVIEGESSDSYASVPPPEPFELPPLEPGRSGGAVR